MGIKFSLNTCLVLQEVCPPPKPTVGELGWPQLTAHVSLTWGCFLGVHKLLSFREEAKPPVGLHPS